MVHLVRHVLLYLTVTQLNLPGTLLVIWVLDLLCVIWLHSQIQHSGFVVKYNLAIWIRCLDPTQILRTALNILQHPRVR